MARVAAVWANNGRGVRGDLAAVLRAILLDTEARTEPVATNTTYGKLREPMMRFGHWLRAFNARPNDGDWTIWNLEDPVTSLEQTGPDFIAHDTRVTGFGADGASQCSCACN